MRREKNSSIRVLRLDCPNWQVSKCGENSFKFWKKGAGPVVGFEVQKSLVGWCWIVLIALSNGCWAHHLFRPFKNITEAIDWGAKHCEQWEGQ